MTNSDIPQQENVSDCGVFVYMFCEYILNGCKLNFKQDYVMEGSWQQKIILPILTLCSDNGMVEIIQPTKKAKGKHKKIIDELICTETAREIAWSHQVGDNLQCKENNDLTIECKEWCTSKEQCTNKRIQNKNWKSVEKKQTENRNEYGLFVKENCK